MFFGCEQGRRWVRRHHEAWANSRWATRKIDCKQIRRITWHLLPRRGEPDLKTGESLFISLPVLSEASGNSFRRSQFCHVDTACSTTLSTGWLRLWFHAIVWAVSVRTLPRCCDRSHQKGQTRTYSFLEAFIATVHPQLTGVHRIGETKDGNNKNVH